MRGEAGSTAPLESTLFQEIEKRRGAHLVGGFKSLSGPVGFPQEIQGVGTHGLGLGPDRSKPSSLTVGGTKVFYFAGASGCVLDSHRGQGASVAQHCRGAVAGGEARDLFGGQARGLASTQYFARSGQLTGKSSAHAHPGFGSGEEVIETADSVNVSLVQSCVPG